MDKKKLSESDICDKFIRPAMEQAGWHGLDQIYREFPLRAGRVTLLQSDFPDLRHVGLTLHGMGVDASWEKRAW